MSAVTEGYVRVRGCCSAGRRVFGLVEQDIPYPRSLPRCGQGRPARAHQVMHPDELTVISG